MPQNPVSAVGLFEIWVSYESESNIGSYKNKQFWQLWTLCLFVQIQLLG